MGGLNEILIKNSDRFIDNRAYSVLAATVLTIPASANVTTQPF